MPLQEGVRSPPSYVSVLKYVCMLLQKVLLVPPAIIFCPLRSILQLNQTQIGKPDNQQSSDKDNQKSSDKADHQSSDKANEQLFDKDNQKSSEEHEKPNTDSDEDDNVVPVVTRPGHIRFAPLGKGVYGNYRIDCKFCYAICL